MLTTTQKYVYTSCVSKYHKLRMMTTKYCVHMQYKKLYYAICNMCPQITVTPTYDVKTCELIMKQCIREIPKTTFFLNVACCVCFRQVTVLRSHEVICSLCTGYSTNNLVRESNPRTRQWYFLSQQLVYRLCSVHVHCQQNQNVVFAGKEQLLARNISPKHHTHHMRANLVDTHHLRHFSITL